MTGVVVGVLGVLVLAWRLRKRARAESLAGLNGERPVFSVEPPARRIGKRKDYLL